VYERDESPTTESSREMPKTLLHQPPAHAPSNYQGPRRPLFLVASIVNSESYSMWRSRLTTFAKATAPSASLANKQQNEHTKRHLNGSPGQQRQNRVHDVLRRKQTQTSKRFTISLWFVFFPNILDIAPISPAYGSLLPALPTALLIRCVSSCTCSLTLCLVGV
jgi:hypothetical protein